METNGIPRCPKQKGCCITHCCCLQTWELIQKRGQERNALATPLPFRSSGAHCFELFLKRRLSANQNAALRLAYFQPNDIARESKSLLRSHHFQAAGYLSPNQAAIFRTLNLSCCLWKLGRDKRSHEELQLIVGICVYRSSFPAVQTPAQLCSGESYFSSAEVLALAGCDLVRTHSSCSAIHFHNTRETGSVVSPLSCMALSTAVPAHRSTPQATGPGLCITLWIALISASVAFHSSDD